MAETSINLIKLENESWGPNRNLYSTAHIPGFPWYSVSLENKKDEYLRHGTEYVLRRNVIPYEYTLRVFVKGRWVGKDLLSVYKEELAHHSPAYYEHALRVGRLRCLTKADLMGSSSRSPTEALDGVPATLQKHNVRRSEMKRNTEAFFTKRTPMEKDSLASTAGNEETKSIDESNCILEDGSVVLHTIHRHEVPVYVGESGADPIVLLSAPIYTYGVLAVQKPTGLPTHPTGRYHYNSVTAMIEYCLAPKRIHAWLFEEDPLLQSLVCSKNLSAKEKEDLMHYFYTSESYATRRNESEGSKCKETHEEEEEISLAKTLRPCYRLDKPTSGILLLGVHQNATGRISSALMNKTLSMEKMVQSCVEGTQSNSGYETLIKTLCNTDFGVQKRYLAKVIGNFNPATLQMSLQHLDIAPLPLTAENFKCLFEKSGASCSLSKYGGKGVLLCNPVQAVSHGSSISKVNKRTTFQEKQCAVTACQHLNTSEVSTDTTTILSVPFTGRKNQIRLHLNDHGYSILYDPLKDLEENKEEKRTSSGTHKDEQNATDVKRLFFDENDLPEKYKKLFYSEATRNFYAGKGNCKSSEDFGNRNESETKEPLCYECAQLLPEATLNASEGTSAICLHAFEYVIEEAILLGSSGGGAPNNRKREHEEENVDGTNDKEEQERENDKNENPAGAHCGRKIVFSASAPKWAFT